MICRKNLFFAVVLASTALCPSAAQPGPSSGVIDWGPYLEVRFEAGDGLAGSFWVRVADTDEKRSRGLMHTWHLPLDEGMLFHFGRKQHVAMYMKNTFIPLDMWFIRTDGTVSQVHTWAEPHSLKRIRSRSRVIAVLEINAGLSDLLDIRKGARIIHPAFQNN